MVQGRKKSQYYLGLVLAFIVFFGLVILPPVRGEAPGTDGPLGSFTRITMENGLTLIVKEVHSAPIAAVDIWVGTGAKNETPEITGLSHFFEHMLFKGTAKRKVGEIAREIKGVGGYQNAQTSLDTTHYYVVVPSKEIGLALDVQADAIMNSSFDPQEIEKERQVILEEKRLKEDNPQGKLGLLAYQAVFKGTPYANDVLGNAETLAKINHDTFMNYYRQYYIPSNIAVVVVGDVDTRQIIDQAKSLFKDFQNNGKAQASKKASKLKILKLGKITRIDATMQVDQTYLYFGFPGPGMNDPDEAALSVLGVILGGGGGSRFHQELVEKEDLVNEIGAGYQSYQNIGMFVIYAQMQKGTTTALESEVQKMISQIIKNGVSGEELSRAKAIVRSQIAYAVESNADIASILGEYQVGGDASNAAASIGEIQKVTAKDVQRVARKYLNPQAYVLATVRPLEVK